MTRPVHILLSRGEIRPLLNQPGQRQNPEALGWGPGWGPGDGDRLRVVALREWKRSGPGVGPRGSAVTLSVEEAKFS